MDKNTERMFFETDYFKKIVTQFTNLSDKCFNQYIEYEGEYFHKTSEEVEKRYFPIMRDLYHKIVIYKAKLTELSEPYLSLSITQQLLQCIETYEFNVEPILECLDGINNQSHPETVVTISYPELYKELKNRGYIDGITQQNFDYYIQYKQLTPNTKPANWKGKKSDAWQFLYWIDKKATAGVFNGAFDVKIHNKNIPNFELGGSLWDILSKYSR